MQSLETFVIQDIQSLRDTMVKRLQALEEVQS